MEVSSAIFLEYAGIITADDPSSFSAGSEGLSAIAFTIASFSTKQIPSKLKNGFRGLNLNCVRTPLLLSVPLNPFRNELVWSVERWALQLA